MPLVRVGVALGPHGVRGDLKLSYCTDLSESLRPDASYLLSDSHSGEAVVLRSTDVRLLPDGFCMRFAEFDAPEPLRRFKGWSLMHWAARGALPREDGEVYLFELQGLEVRDAAGAPFAHVVNVVDSGAHILLELDLPGRPYVPYLAQHIPEVDLAAGYLICTYPLQPASSGKVRRGSARPAEEA